MQEVLHMRTGGGLSWRFQRHNDHSILVEQKCKVSFISRPLFRELNAFHSLAALLTYRIRNLWAHRQKSPRDVGNKLGLRKLVHHRARLLKYLRRTDRVRYDILLERIGVEPESVEGELIV